MHHARGMRAQQTRCSPRRSMRVATVVAVILAATTGAAGTSSIVSSATAAAPRAVRVDGQRFVLAQTNASVVLAGPNVVVKGPPYLPSVSGSSVCNDVVNDQCQAAGNCSSCTTFNEADVAHIKARGWNSIRLGVVWAGAQPRDENQLDPDFLKRLHALLDLTDRGGIAVVLDNHGDAVGSANCGNGVPMWFSQKASPVCLDSFAYTCQQPCAIQRS